MILKHCLHGWSREYGTHIGIALATEGKYVHMHNEYNVNMGLPHTLQVDDTGTAMGKLGGKTCVKWC